LCSAFFFGLGDKARFEVFWQVHFDLIKIAFRHINFFLGNLPKFIGQSKLHYYEIMKVLNIEGVISSREDAAKFAEGEKFFAMQDLEAFVAEANGEPFEVVIKSPGGSVEEGFRIYNLLKSLDVTTTALTANSIASVIFLAGKTRKVTVQSEIIIHNAWVDAEVLAGEKLNVHTLSALTEMFAATDMQILDVYTKVAGADKSAKLLALMSQESSLSAELALSLGFATEIVEGVEKSVSFKNRVLTFSKNQTDLIESQNIINRGINMKTEEKLTAFEKALNGLKNIFKAQMKNMLSTTAEGVAIFITDGEDGDLVGKTVFLAEEGLPTETPAPAGPHVLEDGSTITIDEGGVITEVTAPAVSEDVEAVQAQLADMEKEKLDAEANATALSEQVTAQAKVIADSKAQLAKLVIDFSELKNAVAGDPDIKKKMTGVLPAEDFAKLSTSEKIRLRAMNKAEAA